MSNLSKRPPMREFCMQPRISQLKDMDTVQEETQSQISTPVKESPRIPKMTLTRDPDQESEGSSGIPLLSPEGFEWPEPSHRRASEIILPELYKQGNSSQRRPSAIMAALRRPSQAISLATAQAIANQKKMWTEFMARSRTSLAGGEERKPKDFKSVLGDDALATALSALYAKLLVVLGVAFPITEIVSLKVPASFYQGFYLYLYSVSVAYVIFIYSTLAQEKAVYHVIDHMDSKDKHNSALHTSKPPVRFGSFYLRLGAIAFGIGSMVYSGLEFGQYFERTNDPHCQNVMLAVTPAIRMFLTLLQMQFIFMNSREMSMNRYKLIARFGMMHMIATNLCEWLYVLVAETKHEIAHLEHAMDAQTGGTAVNLNITLNSTTHTVAIQNCKSTNIMGSLVQNASPFLFPCTIEYSLICAVIVFEMWKKMKVKPVQDKKKTTRTNSGTPTKLPRRSSIVDRIASLSVGHLWGAVPGRSQHHFSLDCSNSHRGLFGGILIIVLTIISLIIFFVLSKDPVLAPSGIFEVNVCELVLYGVTIVGVIVAIYQTRRLTYTRQRAAVLGLDTTLLIVAQAGMFIYCMFSIIGSYFTIDDVDGSGITGFLSELFSLAQTILQTMFILDAWWRRTTSSHLARIHPGRQIVTFLLVANMAMWTINTLEKNRAEFRPTHLKFFGFWAWTIITHVSMPLAIFYRFHSTICLFEIWKKSYKYTENHAIPNLQNSLEA